MLFIVRMAAMLIFFVVVASMGLLLCLARPFNPDNSRLIARWFAWGGLKILGMRVQSEGLEHLKNQGPCVVISNHQDNLDLFVLGGFLPRRAVSVGKKSLLWIPLFGVMYWLAGNVLIDRGNRKKALDAMGEVVKALTQRNTSIWIFPEGTRSRGRGMQPFKKGAFHTAIQAGVPIVPVCASSYIRQCDLGRLHSGDVRVRALPPIPTEGLTSKDVEALMESCFQQMKDCVAELDSLTQQQAAPEFVPALAQGVGVRKADA